MNPDRIPTPFPGEPGISLSAYARYRGCSLMTVTRAVKKGRITQCVRKIADRTYIVDVPLADREWEANTVHTTTPPGVVERLHGHQPKPRQPRPRNNDEPAGDDDVPDVDENMTLSQASAIEKRWKAKLARLEYEKKSGELIDAKEVQKKMENAFAACRAKVLGLSVRARQRLPHLSVDDVATIDEITREALEDLSVDADVLATADGE